MKYTVVLLASAMLAAVSCKEFTEGSHMDQMSQMKDSILSRYPSVGAVTINVQNRTLLIITLGSKKLAKSTDAARQRLAADLGAMTLRLFGKDNSIEQEKLIITPNERNDMAEPADGMVTMLDIDSLQKTMAH